MSKNKVLIDEETGEQLFNDIYGMNRKQKRAYLSGFKKGLTRKAAAQNRDFRRASKKESKS